MFKSWLLVLVAAFFEVIWVIGLKYSATPIEWGGTLLAIFLSFYLMIEAGKKIPVGTVYAVFVGLGTTGTVLVDTLVFGENMTISKVIFVGLLIIGILGLTFVSSDKKEVS